MPKQLPCPAFKSRIPPSTALAEHMKRVRIRVLQRLEGQVRGEYAPLFVRLWLPSQRLDGPLKRVLFVQFQ